MAAALSSLRDVELPQAEVDQSGDILAGLSARAPEETAKADDLGSALSSLAAVEIEETPADDSTDILGDLAAQELVEAVDTSTDDALSSLAAVEVDEAPEDDSADILGDLAAQDVAEAVDTSSDDALSSLAAVEVDEAPEDDSADILGDLAAQDVAEAVDTSSDDALSSLAAVEIDETPEDDGTDILGDLAAQDLAEAVDTSSDDALSSLAAVEVDEAPEDDSADILGDLAALDVVEEVDTSSDDALSSLAAVEIGEGPEDDGADILGDLAALDLAEEVDTSSDDALSRLAAVEIDEAPEDDSADILGDLAALDVAEEVDTGADDLSALLGGLDDVATPQDNIDDILGGLGDLGAEETDAPLDAGGLDDLLGDLEAADAETEEADAQGLDDLLGDLSDAEDGDDLDGLFADLEDDAAAEPEGGDGLDDLLGDLTGADDSGLDALLGDTSEGEDGDLDLDDLLGSLEDDSPEAGDDLDDLLGALDSTDDSTDDGAAEAAEAVKLSQTEEPEFAYGTLSASRPEPQRLVRKRFRLAILGDFSGRAAKGIVEIGDQLAARRAVILDPDTVEDVIESFATELVLPIGRDGAGMAVKLGGLDDLHPDELYENVELFSELVGLRKQLQSGVTADHAASTLRAWGEKHGTRVSPPKPRSGGNAVPADCRLSAFQLLVGDAENQLGQVSPVQDLLARVVGPHIRALPNADVAAMIVAVDAALSDAMRMVLHHPEFQSLEAQWRSLDLIARSVEDDDTLDVMLYDISAEELAADLTASEDLSDSGFVKLLTGEPLDEENGRGGYSALIGLYQFEETPPHAELLGRIARVAAHVDAPFLAGISPAFLETEKDKLPSVVTKAWDTLRGMGEAGHLGLVSPRFMLRRPYGAKSEPIYEFQFEEFTESEGLRGLLWANPVVLAAILLARSFKQNGASMGLGQIMSLGDIPFHYVNDRFGDQVALPCTERNINLDKIALAQERGFMAVSAIKGRDEIRLTSFGSLAGGDILGPWTGMPAPDPSPPDPKPAAAADPAGDDLDDLGLDDLDLDLGLDDDDSGLGDLDDLLAGFGDDTDDSGEDDDDSMDADLAALLDDL
ncbi:type VI secretion system contractile sheath domain-containing protein [Parasedimentitalea psychrophila]|uniref:Type VI secretion system contractile sheath large subunit n=1 Tax=Parasedimentitalea psychrophila TaxID=2997337 RepID=A0A9Y2L339_9RHOB|nr:type VI secretion system contractile sheath large subunit [Parasedimentitalea psychrophila]WIY27821.1 type VI secretion system contractile sheath large subunit [Parasedimentitalea psychrophila]